MAKGDASYAQVERAVWTKSRFRNLSDDERLLILYLVTCPHATQAGLFRLPPGYACDDLQWSPNRYEKALNGLIEEGLVKFDQANGIILNPNQMKKFPPQNGNQVAGIIGKLKEVPTTPLLNDLADIVANIDRDYISQLSCYLSERLGNRLETVSKGLGDPETETGAQTETGDQGCCRSSSLKQEQIARFNVFYAAYPKKKAKKEALQAWKTLAPENGLFETIIAAVAKQKRSDDWTRENGRFIPNPASWLNGRRWEDEIETSPLKRKSTW